MLLDLFYGNTGHSLCNLSDWKKKKQWTEYLLVVVPESRHESQQLKTVQTVADNHTAQIVLCLQMTAILETIHIYSSSLCHYTVPYS